MEEYVALSGDLLQLPPVQRQQIFIKHQGEHQAFQGLVLEDVFHLYKLTDIACQSSDPEFADKLSRVREAKQTSTDIKKIEALEDTDNTTRPEKFINLYFINYLAGK